MLLGAAADCFDLFVLGQLVLLDGTITEETTCTSFLVGIVIRVIILVLIIHEDEDFCDVTCHVSGGMLAVFIAILSQTPLIIQARGQHSFYSGLLVPNTNL